MKHAIDKDQPAWICGPCGTLYGRRAAGISTWHDGDRCGVCSRELATTEPRDFGYLRAGWKAHFEKWMTPT